MKAVLFHRETIYAMYQPTYLGTTKETVALTITHLVPHCLPQSCTEIDRHSFALPQSRRSLDPIIRPLSMVDCLLWMYTKEILRQRTVSFHVSREIATRMSSEVQSVGRDLSPKNFVSVKDPARSFGERSRPTDWYTGVRCHCLLAF